jgi:hypothetical protein
MWLSIIQLQKEYNPVICSNIDGWYNNNYIIEVNWTHKGKYHTLSLTWGNEQEGEWALEPGKAGIEDWKKLDKSQWNPIR